MLEKEYTCACHVLQVVTLSTFGRIYDERIETHFGFSSYHSPVDIKHNKQSTLHLLPVPYFLVANA